MYFYLLSFLIPFVPIAVSIITEGQMLPSLTDHKTWTIEYTPMILASIFGVFVAYKGFSKTHKKTWFYTSIIFNILIGLFFLCASIYLWGEKF